MNDDHEPRQLPLDTAGTKLMNARTAAKRSLGDIANTTRIPERHLAALEQGRFADLPGRSYALGFTRSYAQAVELNPDAIAGEMRGEMDAAPRVAEPLAAPVFTPGDPNRLPSRRVAWIAGGCALAVALASLLVLKVAYAPAGSLPSLLPSPAPSPATAAAKPAAAPALAAGLPVVFTATQPNIWVKFYDKSGTQLMLKQMAQGESYTVPANAVGPMLRTGRPDALTITIGGKPQPPLATKQMTMKDVPVSQAALLARATPPGAALPAATTPAGALPSAPHAVPGAAIIHHTPPQPTPAHHHARQAQPSALHDETAAPPPATTGAEPPAAAAVAPAPAAPPPAAPTNPSTVSH